MSPPRVLALTHSLSGIDGVGRYGVALLRHLAPVCGGIDVFLGRRHRGFADDLPREGVNVHAVLASDHYPFLPLARLLWVVLDAFPTLVRAARRADVVHSLADYPMGFLAALVGRASGRPVIVSGHGTYSVTPLFLPVHGRLIRWMYARADRFLMGADYALRRVREHVEPRAAEVVPYGCTPADYDAVAARGERPGVPEPYVLCVGEVKQRKGYETSLPAFLATRRRRPDLHFVVVGRYAEDDDYYRGLRRQIEEAGAAGHVHFLGSVSEARKVALLRGARVFVLTSRTSEEGSFEAFGLVYLEAGAAGRPVLGVNDSGAEDAIRDGENGFLRARTDPEGLAAALLRMVEDEALAERMGAAGRRRAEQQTWAAAARRVREIYAELLPARSGAAPRTSRP